jgi:iron complex outermembrane recepter protein
MILNSARSNSLKRLATTAAMILNIAPAKAQTEASTPNTAESSSDIIITATKRSERLQDVALSITSLGAQQLETKGVTNFLDYGTSVPNLAFANTGDGSASSRTISIRGVAGDNTTGFYLDETPVIDSIDPKIVDIERIEVLRGPQGTLYGARSMGGTVRVITKQPDLNEFSGRLRAQIGTTRRTSDQNYMVDGAVNLPLVDGKVAARAVAFYQNDAGFFKRRIIARPGIAPVPPSAPRVREAAVGTTFKNVGEQETYGAALSIQFKVTDTLTITPRVLHQKTESNGFSYSDVFLTAPDQTVLKPKSFIQERFFDIPEGGFDRWMLFSLDARYDAGFGEFVSSTSYFDRKVDETEDQTDFLYVALLNGILGVTTPVGANISQEVPFERFVQEVRFVSSFEGPFQMVLGAYFAHTKDGEAFTPPAVAVGFDAASGFAFGTDLIYSNEYKNRTREPAVFGEFSYQLMERLKFSAGLRWYQITTQSRGFQDGFAAGGRFEDVASGVYPTGTPFRSKEDGVNPKFQIDYKASDDILLFATAAKGFRPGGIAPSVPLSPALGCDVSLAQLGLTPEQVKRYKSDSLWSYEVGAKTQWLDRRLTLNGSAFWIDWTNIQQQILLPCGFQFRANSAAARIRGFEMEMRARATENLELTAGLGYLDAEITKASQGGATSPQLPGDRIFSVPKWTFNAAAILTQPITDEVEMVGSVDISYVGNSTSANNNPFVPRIRPSYTLLNARLAARWNAYEIALFGKNLTDEIANFADSRSLAAETPGRPRVVVNQPRTIGLEAKVNF